MTKAIGVFNYAESYRRAAKQLMLQDGGWTHPDSPIRFLLFHACELYLKSYLWNEISQDDLRSNYGHSLKKAYSKARELGLKSTPWAEYAFSNFDFKDTINERYLKVGLFLGKIETDGLSYLAAELCLATHEKFIEEFPNLPSQIEANSLLDLESFKLPSSLGGGYNQNLMVELDKALEDPLPPT